MPLTNPMFYASAWQLVGNGAATHDVFVLMNPVGSSKIMRVVWAELSQSTGGSAGNTGQGRLYRCTTPTGGTQDGIVRCDSNDTPTGVFYNQASSDGVASAITAAGVGTMFIPCGVFQSGTNVANNGRQTQDYRRLDFLMLRAGEGILGRIYSPTAVSANSRVWGGIAWTEE